ncbi:glycosyl hydrolase 108 family protein, partial [Labilibacter marinus]|uniref:glycosyl hydrolase 108 family protein n=1 Tax=Labilibacter marinus TaxID=1477105 RepID=UPI000833B782
MKTFNKLFEKVIKHEGYYANVTGDRGGETYMGITRNLHPHWEGWNFVDAYKIMHGIIKHNEKINNPQLTKLVKEFYKHTFYHSYNIDKINHYCLQEIIFDWCVNSGHWGSRNIQRMLNKSFNAYLTIDGIIG